MLSDLLEHGFDISPALPHARAGLHLHAVYAGYEQRRNEVYAWDGMTRGTSPFLVIQHTLVGEGRLDYAGTQHRLRPGQTMLVTMPHDHRYYLTRGGHWEYFWLLLSGREAMRMARDILDHAGPVLAPDTGVTDRLAAACLGLIKAPSSEGHASATGYAALAALHDAAFMNDARSDAQSIAIARIMSHVDKNLAQPLTIDHLATTAGLSRAHFVRRFTAEVGIPPSDYVMARRLDRIERLLLATELTVGEIAAMTGFADGNYLAKAFRRHRGMSPLDYRATRAEAG